MVIQQSTTLHQHHRPIGVQEDEEEFESAADAEALFKELLELGVEDGVDDGVESAVDVAQPGDGAHQAGRDVAGQAQGSRGVDHEERRPAEQEAAWENRVEAEV